MFDNFGTIEVGNSDWLDNAETLNNYGSLINNNRLTTLRRSLVSNFGELINNGQMNNDGTLTNLGTLVNDGLIVNYGPLENFGTLKGNGYTVADAVNDSGTLAPGNSAGVLSFHRLAKTGGSLEIELGGDFDGGGDKLLTEFDWLDITDELYLGGTLDVQFINGFTLDNLYSFKVINCNGVFAGQFDGLGEGDIVGNFGGVDLFITYSGGDGNDVVLYNLTSVPEPGTACILMLGLGLLATRRRKRLTVA